MEELIGRITTATGLDAGTARKAVGTILNFLQKEGPASPVGQVIDAIPGAREAANDASEASTNGGGLMGGLMGMVGGSGGLMGLAGKLQAQGVGMGEMPAVGRAIFTFAREKVGEETVGAIAAEIPGLSQFI